MTKETNEQHMLWGILNVIYENISKHVEKSFKKSILTRSQYIVLLNMAFLIEYEKTPIKITDLMPYNNGSLANVSSLIERMVKKGLVKKVRDKNDQRIVRINLTSLGQKELKKSLKPTTELIKNIFSVYSNKEINLLISLLNKLSLSLDQKPMRQNISKRVPVESRVAFLNKMNG